MTSPISKAKQYLDKYGREDAVIQAQQCMELAPFYKRSYWDDVVKNIKDYG